MMQAAEAETMQKATPITCLFVDIGGALLTDGRGRESRKLAWHILSSTRPGIFTLPAEACGHEHRGFPGASGAPCPTFTQHPQATVNGPSPTR
jgi:hypothetical protein